MPNYTLASASGGYAQTGTAATLDRSLVIEDGSGRPDSQSYLSVAFADGHHAARGNTKWDEAGLEEKEAALVRATDYIDKRFGRRFRGFRRAKDQALEWPRLDAFDDDGYLLSGSDVIPRKLQRATAEYALRAFIYFVLAPDPLKAVPDQSMESGAASRSTTSVVGQVVRLRKKVGPLEVDTSYGNLSATADRLGGGGRWAQSDIVNDYSIPEYPEADMWIDELLTSKTSQRLVRA